MTYNYAGYIAPPFEKTFCVSVYDCDGEYYVHELDDEGRITAFKKIQAHDLKTSKTNFWNTEIGELPILTYYSDENITITDRVDKLAKKLRIFITRVELGKYSAFEVNEFIDKHYHPELSTKVRKQTQLGTKQKLVQRLYEVYDSGVLIEVNEATFNKIIQFYISNKTEFLKRYYKFENFNTEKLTTNITWKLNSYLIRNNESLESFKFRPIYLFNYINKRIYNAEPEINVSSCSSIELLIFDEIIRNSINESYSIIVFDNQFYIYLPVNSHWKDSVIPEEIIENLVSKIDEQSTFKKDVKANLFKLIDELTDLINHEFRLGDNINLTSFVKIISNSKSIDTDDFESNSLRFIKKNFSEFGLKSYVSVMRRCYSAFSNYDVYQDGLDFKGYLYSKIRNDEESDHGFKETSGDKIWFAIEKFWQLVFDTKNIKKISKRRRPEGLEEGTNLIQQNTERAQG